MKKDQIIQQNTCKFSKSLLLFIVKEMCNQSLKVENSYFK